MELGVQGSQGVLYSQEKLIKETEKEQPMRKDKNQDSVTEVENKVLQEGGSNQSC